MLPKKYRLTQKKDIESVFRKGYIFSHPALILRAAPNGGKKLRFAFVVSNGVSKKAVVRNTIRRRLRAIIYLNLDKIFKSADVVISAKPQVLKIEFNEMKVILEGLLKRSGLLTQTKARL